MRPFQKNKQKREKKKKKRRGEDVLGVWLK
jgi:hypothetical protein